MRYNMRFIPIVKNKRNEDEKISIAIMASFVILTLQYLILVSFNIMEGPRMEVVQNVSKLLVGLVFLYSFPIVFRRSKATIVVTYLIAIFIIILHYLLFPDNQKAIISLIFPLFFMSIPGFIYSRSLNDIKAFKRMMKKSSFFIFFIGLTIQLMVVIGNVSIGTYSMALSYYLLFSAILFADDLIDTFRFQSLIALIVTIFIIIALGSRGPLLSLFMFVVLKLIKQRKRLTYQKFVFTLSIALFSILALLNLEKIFIFLYNLLLNYGINSRTLWIFINEEFYLSGRDTIYHLLMEYIANKPLLGHGIGGDRVLIGGYAHNIFLEILINFGVIFGGIILLVLLITMIYRLSSKSRMYYNILIIWISYGFIHLMVSSSYLTDIKFWILIGILLNKGLIKDNTEDIKL